MTERPALHRLEDIGQLVRKDDGRCLFAASETEIRRGDVTDVYFLKTLQILEEEGLADTPVGADIRSSGPGVFAGSEEVRRLLEGLDITLRSLGEGETMSAHETVMQIEGPYGRFCLHETALLGIMAATSGWATAAHECVAVSGKAKIACFASRHVHPSVAPAMERAALVGGCVSASNILGARLSGRDPVGTTPHSLALVAGDTLRAAEMYLKHLGDSGPLVCLVDTFNDETVEALRLADALGDRLYGIRLDTPGERGGVTPALVRETRVRLDQAGHTHVRIYVSGGINPQRIPALVEAGADAFGIGSYISDARPIDMTLDLKQINGKPVAKRGRQPGLTRNDRLRRIYP